MTQLDQVISWPHPKTIKFWLPLTFALATGGLLVTVIFATLIYQLIYLDRVYPGISVLGIDAGGMTQPEVVSAISQRLPDYLSQAVTIQTAGESWTFTGQELGIRIDVAILANKAYAIGREGNFLADVLTQMRLLTSPREVEPLLWYDTGPGNQVLRDLADQIYRPPQNAQLIIQPDGRIEAIPAQRGRQLHIDATRSLIETALFSHDRQPVQAVVQEIIPALTNIEPARQQAERLLSQPIVFRVETETEVKRWQIKPETVVTLIDVVAKNDENGQAYLALELAPEKFTPFLEQIANTVAQEAIDAELSFDDEQGELVVVEPSRDGYTLDLELAYAQLRDILEKPAQEIAIPLIVTSPAVSSKALDSLGIEELVSESISYFKGSSEGRMNNIALAASKFDGVIVPPGQIFSFNKYLGEVNKANGFDESLIIFGNRTTVGIGGGVCQVSTTAFRTAFFGGFEIVERWAHGYRVGWYEINSEPGLDATVYTPDIDFKFRNDTAHYLLIQTETDLEAGTLTFRFYGTPTEREVIVSKPLQSNPVMAGPPVYEEDPFLPQGTIKQVDWANDGMEVTVTRVVKEGEKVLHQDTLVSRYRPWQAVYKVGTGGNLGAGNGLAR